MFYSVFFFFFFLLRNFFFRGTQGWRFAVDMYVQKNLFMAQENEAIC